MDAAATITDPDATRHDWKTRHDWRRWRDALGRPLCPNPTKDDRPSHFAQQLEKSAKLNRSTMETIKGPGKIFSRQRRKELTRRAKLTPEYTRCSTILDIYDAAGGSGAIPLDVIARDLPDILINLNAYYLLDLIDQLLVALESLRKTYRNSIIIEIFVAESEPHAGAPPDADPAPRPPRLIESARPCSAGRKGAGHARPSRHPVARRHIAACGTNITMR